MHRVRAAGLILSSSLFAVGTVVADDTTPQCSEPDPPPGVETVVFDLGIGWVAGRTQYAASQQVQLRFTNKNPFQFDYRIEIESRPFPEPGLDFFLGLFPGFGLEEQPTPDERDVRPETLKPVACKDVQILKAVEGSKIETHEKDLEASSHRVFNAIKNLNAMGLDLAATTEKLVAGLSGEGKTCDDLVQNGRDLVTAASTDELKTALKALSDGKQDLQNQIGRFSISLGSFEALLLEQQCDARRTQESSRKYHRILDRMREDVDKATDAIGLAKKRIDEIDKRRASITEILDNPDSFHSTRLVGGERQILTVRVFRKAKSSSGFPTTPFVERTLRFGQQQFVLSLGVAFASLDSREYDIEQGFARNPDGEIILDDGEPVLTRVVTLTDDSDHRINPALILHARLGGPKKATTIQGVYASLGLTASLADNAVDVEYLVGVSLGFSGNKFFVTLGAYNGRVESLLAGFYEGVAVPESITAAPVRYDREWSAALALSYKVK